MPKYKVCYSGYAFIEAESEEEAKDKFLDDDEWFYDETSVDLVMEVDEFIWRI